MPGDYSHPSCTGDDLWPVTIVTRSSERVKNIRLRPDRAEHSRQSLCSVSELYVFLHILMYIIRLNSPVSEFR